MSTEVFAEIIKECTEFGCNQFRNLFEALQEVNPELEDYHHGEINDFLNITLNISSEGELDELTDFEIEKFKDFVVNLY
jgi:hypothetical protein